MGYSRDLLDYAQQQLSWRRNHAKAVASERKEELCQHIPRLGEIERELAGTGMELVKVVMQGATETALAVGQIQEKNQMLQKERAEILHQIGLPEDYLDVKHHCEKCRDEGYCDGRRCSCMETLLREEKLKRLNRVSSLALSRFDTFRLDYYPSEAGPNGITPRKRMEWIYRYCRDYAAAFGQGSESLLMIGATGLGKTHLSLAIAAQVIAGGYEAVYGSVQDLLRQIEEEKFGRDNGRYDTLESLLACDLLILDDLGAEFTTGFTTSILYNLINTRINADKATIISTNLSLKELNAQYADRIVSRLIGKYTTLQFLGNDVRRLLLERR